MNELLKPGESGWFRRRDGEIAVAFRVPVKLERPIWWWTKCNSGGAKTCGSTRLDGPSEHDLLERLPDCTGFDWKPEKTYKPWTLDTVPQMVLVRAKVVRLERQVHRYVIRPASDEHVMMANHVLTYQHLFDNYVQLDGTPCGVEE